MPSKIKQVISFVKKSIKFFYNYALHSPSFVFSYGLAYFQKEYDVGAKFYSNQETVELIKQGKSFIRLGDGEISMMHGRGISYQKYEKGLEKTFRAIVSQYTKNSNYILAIPVFAKYLNHELENTQGKLQCWLPLKVEFKRTFKKNESYADAHIFYYKNFFDDNLTGYFSSKKLIINTTQKNIDNQKDKIESRFNVIDWIEAKEPNPYDWYEKTKQKVDEILIKNKDEISNLVLILGSGPMSKRLAFDYCNKVQCIDIGKGFEHLYNDKNFEHEI